MVLFRPEENTADEKAAYLIAAVIEHGCIPIRMKILRRIHMLEEMAAVALVQDMLIGGK